MIKPYLVNIPQPILNDLNLRLSLTRWPDEIEGWSVPLIITHGWPGSFLEMIKLIHC
jgi:hypothetical protein